MNTASKEILESITKQDVYAEKMCELIKSVVCAYYQLPVSIFDNRSRLRPIIKAKQVTTYFLRKALPKTTLLHIGKMLKYDHASILHNLRAVNNLLQTDKEMQTDIKAISKILDLEASIEKVDGNIDNDFYYINMDNCVSIKMEGGKAMILVGYTIEDASVFVANHQDIMKGILPVEHKQTGLLILQKKQNDE